MDIRSNFHNSVTLMWALVQFLQEDETDAEAHYCAWERIRAEYLSKWTENTLKLSSIFSIKVDDSVYVRVHLYFNLCRNGYYL